MATRIYSLIADMSVLTWINVILNGAGKTDRHRDSWSRASERGRARGERLRFQGRQNFPTTISDEKTYQGKFIIKNNGNSYLWQIPVEIKAKNIAITKGKFVIPVLAPLEKKSITFDYSSSEKYKRVQGILIINVLQKQFLEQKINIIPFIYTLIIKVFIVLLGLSALFLIYRLFRKIKRRDH